MSLQSIRPLLQELYHAHTRRGVAFRYGMLLFDLSTIAFLILSSFFEGESWVEIADILIGAILLADVTARFTLAPQKLKFLFNPLGLADIIVVFSLLIPLAGEQFAFLRVLRALRLFRSYEVVHRLKQDFRFFQANQDIIFAGINLLVFIFIMTALVYETQHHKVDTINNYVDALYFTITTLTTTGFGDITMNDSGGRILAVLIMIFGVSLFLRLIQTVLRPTKVNFQCPNCGLLRHDLDAVHCKHCGITLAIPNEGID